MISIILCTYTTVCVCVCVCAHVCVRVCVFLHMHMCMCYWCEEAIVRLNNCSKVLFITHYKQCWRVVNYM